VTKFRDRQGNPLGLMDWARKLEDDSYTVVKQEILPNGLLISTVWIGIDEPDKALGFGHTPLFETAVFDNRQSLSRVAYHTEREALAGHHNKVTEFKGWQRPVTKKKGG
jgi:hypothetical protein